MKEPCCKLVSSERKARFITIASCAVLFLSTLPMLGGCTDAAEADYLRCERLDKEGKFEEAVLACQEAQKKDARSPHGQNAIKLEIKLYSKISELERQKAAQAAENAEAEALDTAHTKVVFNQLSTPPNDPHDYSERCMARNRAFENSYNCDPKDPSADPSGDEFPFKNECMLIAKDRGCVPFYPDSPTKLFCCTK